MISREVMRARLSDRAFQAWLCVLGLVAFVAVFEVYRVIDDIAHHEAAAVVQRPSTFEETEATCSHGVVRWSHDSWECQPRDVTSVYGYYDGGVIPKWTFSNTIGNTTLGGQDTNLVSNTGTSGQTLEYVMNKDAFTVLAPSAVGPSIPAMVRDGASDCFVFPGGAWLPCAPHRDASYDFEVTHCGEHPMTFGDRHRAFIVAGEHADGCTIRARHPNLYSVNWSHNVYSSDWNASDIRQSISIAWLQPGNVIEVAETPHLVSDYGSWVQLDNFPGNTLATSIAAEIDVEIPGPQRIACSTGAARGAYHEDYVIHGGGYRLHSEPHRCP